MVGVADAEQQQDNHYEMVSGVEAKAGPEGEGICGGVPAVLLHYSDKYELHIGGLYTPTPTAHIRGKFCQYFVDTATSWNHPHI